MSKVSVRSSRSWSSLVNAILINFFLISAAAFAQTGRILEIYGTYDLSESHYGKIIIMADNLTLYMNGLVVWAASPYTDVGIDFNGHSNVTIQGRCCGDDNTSSCVRNFTTGVRLSTLSQPTHNNYIKSVYTAGCSNAGFDDHYGTNNTLEKCSANYNTGDGIRTYGTTGFSMYSVNLYNNTVGGYDSRDGNYERLANVISRYNYDNCIEFDYAHYFQLWSCTGSNSTAHHGISFAPANTNGFLYTTQANNNFGDGFHFRDNSYANDLYYCTASGNKGKNFDDPYLQVGPCSYPHSTTNCYYSTY